MESKLLKIIKKIRSETPRFKLGDLKKKCDEYIETFTKKGSEVSARSSTEGNDADCYFDVFQLALESRFPRVIENALDGLATLIEDCHLRGSSGIPESLLQNAKYLNISSIVDELDEGYYPAPDAKQGRSLIDHIIMCISLCCEETDEGVQSQLLKTLLTAATSSYCDVQGNSLLLVIRCCFHIYLNTRNSTIKGNAKGTVDHDNNSRTTNNSILSPYFPYLSIPSYTNHHLILLWVLSLS